MRKIKISVTMICMAALMICMTANIKAKADDIVQTAPEVLQQVGAGTMTSIAYAYANLSSEQKNIAAYLIGAYNHVYLMARGFSYSIPQTETALKAQLIALGDKVWQLATTAYGWKSRFNETFRQYLSSVLVYVDGLGSSVTFSNWYYNNTGDNTLYIPYSENALDAWTAFYNDPSGDGIAHFGEEIGSWQSGQLYDFAFTGIPWYSSGEQQNYNNFILNNSPVLFTSQEDGTGSGYSGSRIQVAFGSFSVLPDALFLSRNSLSQFRFGFSNITPISSSSRYNSYIIWKRPDLQNKLVGLSQTSQQYQHNIINVNGMTSYEQLIQYAFDYTPITHYYSGVYFSFYYPYIEHVYLVDDLNTLSNPEEVYNVDDLNIIAPSSNFDPYIIAPNDRLLFTTRPIGYDDPLNFWDIMIDNSVDENGVPATQDDFTNQIVNNTVINNYYVTNDDRINVPVNWFDNELTDQLANDSIPFLQFARDCIDTLGDLQIYLYGAIVFGLGGGILKKFLL